MFTRKADNTGTPYSEQHQTEAGAAAEGKYKALTVTSQSPSTNISKQQTEDKAPDTQLTTRSTAQSTTKALNGNVEPSSLSQTEYLLSHPFTPVEKTKVIDLFVDSMNTEELKKLALQPSLNLTKDIRIWGDSANSKAVKTMGFDQDQVKRSIKEALAHTDTPLATYPGSLKLSDASLQVFRLSMASGYTSTTLNQWNGIPPTKPATPLPESLQKESLDLSVSIVTAGNKNHVPTPEQVLSFADTEALSKLEAKQLQSDEKTARAVDNDHQSVRRDSNRLHITLESCEESIPMGQKCTTTLFDSSHLPSTAATAEASQEGLEKRKATLENAFSSFIDSSPQGKAVFLTFVHQGPLNELAAKFIPTLPMQPTYDSDGPVQQGSNVRFIQTGPNSLKISSTNRYNCFADTKGAKTVGDGILNMTVQLQKRGDTWTCQHATVTYRDNVNPRLQPVTQSTSPGIKRKTKRPWSKFTHRRTNSDSALEAMRVETSAVIKRSVVDMKSGDWLVAPKATCNFLEQLNQQKKQVQRNFSLNNDIWEKNLQAASGFTSESVTPQQLEFAQEHGIDTQLVEYQAQLKGLAQSLTEATRTADFDFKSLQSSANQQIEASLSEDDIKELFKDELKKYSKTRESISDKAVAAYLDFRQKESERDFDVDRTQYQESEQAFLGQLIELYKKPRDWHAGQYQVISQKLETINDHDFSALASEKSHIAKLRKESEQLIRGYREKGSKGSELKQKLKFDQKKSTEFSELSSRTFVHQKALFYQLEKYEAALDTRINTLEAEKSHSPSAKMLPETVLPSRELSSSTGRRRLISETDDLLLDNKEFESNTDYKNWLKTLPMSTLIGILSEEADISDYSESSDPEDVAEAIVRYCRQSDVLENLGSEGFRPNET